jgi:hypothetical protein
LRYTLGVKTLSIILLLFVAACGCKSAPKPTDPGPATPTTAAECEAAGYQVVGDIGDGKVQCPGGAEEVSRITYGVEGGLCCKGDDTSACQVDDDCVPVELECCDACNGGKAIAVAKDHVDEVMADSPRGRGECGETMCTEMGCAPWVASCHEGLCTLSRGEL